MAASRVERAESDKLPPQASATERQEVREPTSPFARRFPGFTLRPTGAFWTFLVAVPVLGLAALNTGNNALYLMLSLAMGAFVASGAFSRHTLSRVRVRLSAPPEVFAGAPVALRLVVSNLSFWLPAATVVCRLEGMPGHAVVGWVPPRGSVEASMPTVFRRRGRRALPTVVVEVRLPLNFFVKAVRWKQHGEVLVYPRRVRVGAIRWARLSRRETVTSRERGRRGGEVDQLREFRPGDDTRDIHWKQTARQQRTIVMERRELAVPVRYLVLDRQLSRRDSALLRERFEDLVSEVFSSAFAELRRGQPVGLVVGGAVTRPGTGPGHARRLFEQLALVEPVGPGEDPLPGMLSADAVYRLAELR